MLSTGFFSSALYCRVSRVLANAGMPPLDFLLIVVCVAELAVCVLCRVGGGNLGVSVCCERDVEQRGTNSRIVNSLGQLSA